MVEENHAVRNVFLQSVTSQRALAAFARDDRRNAFILQPAEQPTQLRTQHSGIGKTCEKGLGSIEENALGLNRIDRGVQADEQAFQIVLAGLGDLAFVDVNVIDNQLLRFLKLFQVESQGGDIHRQIPCGFLKRNAHAGFAELQRAAHQELDSEERLSAA